MSRFIINSSNLSLELPELALDGQWGMLHSYMTHPHPLDIEKDICVLEESLEDQLCALSGNRGIAVDTLSEFSSFSGIEFYQLY
jgi:hypothetical protein